MTFNWRNLDKHEMPAMRLTTLAAVIVLVYSAFAAVRGHAADAPDKRPSSAALWVSRAIDQSKPNREKVENIGPLGSDLEGKDWLVISTKYNKIYYQDSIDKTKLEQIVRYVDNVYDYLKSWSPACPEIPIKSFLVPNELAHSRCCFETNSMRTGDQGDVITIITSFLHEETHLFNDAYIGKAGQGVWAGEFTCHYFQQRAKLEAKKSDVKRYVKSSLPDGPKRLLGNIGSEGSALFHEAFSVMYFMHKTYGDESFYKFRLECLRQAKTKINSKRDPEDIFIKATGKGFSELNPQWLKFYDWDAKNAVKGGDDAKTAGNDAYQGDSPAVKITREVVAELTRSEYQGRAAGGPGENRAAEYVAGRFKQIAIPPLNRSGSYLQPFNVDNRELIGPIGLRIRGRNFNYKSDFSVLRGGPTEWIEGQMLFVGLGTTDKGDLTFDKNNVRGMVLVAFIRQRLRPVDDKLYTAAKESGAAGILLIYPPDLYYSDLFARKNNQLKNELPVLGLSPKAGEFLLSLDSDGLAKLRKRLLAEPNTKIDIKGTCRSAAGVAFRPNSESRNVIALLKASRPKKPGILVYAHYDGQGREGEKYFYPSANDNASGTAVMTAIASLLSSRRAELSRNVYFAALGAEELGDLGAKKLLDGNLIPWKELGLTICLDMVGRMDQEILTAVTTGDKSPEFLAIKDYAEGRGCKVKPLVREGLGSDAQVIKRSGVPTLFIITAGGPHHVIDDDASNTNPGDMGRLAELLAGFILDKP
jgi:aminopeptidase YwaD